MMAGDQGRPPSLLGSAPAQASQLPPHAWTKAGDQVCAGVNGFTLFTDGADVIRFEHLPSVWE